MCRQRSQWQQQYRPTVPTDLWLHHAVVNPPHGIQRHARVQVDGSRHRLEHVAQRLGDLDVLGGVTLLLLDVQVLPAAARSRSNHTTSYN